MAAASYAAGAGLQICPLEIAVYIGKWLGGGRETHKRRIKSVIAALPLAHALTRSAPRYHAVTLPYASGVQVRVL